MNQYSSGTVWETYNGRVKELRNQGLTLQAIGDQVGVTRERIRQILEEHYGTTEIAGLTARGQLARIIGCTDERLAELEQEGKLNPLHVGVFYLYDRNEAEKAILALQRYCPHCGEPLPLKHQGKYCSKCQKDRRRYNYPFLSEESKRKCNEASRSWQKQHPERYQELQQRAMTRYIAKKKKEHFATTRYVVVYGGVMPIGSIVRAVGCENRHLILENGLRIPVHNVRILREGGSKWQNANDYTRQ